MANEVNGHKWVDESGLPRLTNGAKDPHSGDALPNAPTLPAQPATLNPTEQAAEDWRQIKVYGADQVSLRSKAAARFNELELLTYNLTMGQLRAPRQTRTEARRNWNRQPARRATAKAA